MLNKNKLLFSRQSCKRNTSNILKLRKDILCVWECYAAH